MSRVLVCGAAGRMGGHVIAAVERTPDLELGALLDAVGHPRLGEELRPGFPLGDDLKAALERADVAIDFSAPAATLSLADAAGERGTPVVTGTTGLGTEDQRVLARAAARAAIVQAPNYSLGIHTLVSLVREAVRRLPDYDIEVLELHHSRKIDAPSGTALRLGRAAAEARGLSLDRAAVYHREGDTGARPDEVIGMQSLRAGDSVGEHTVYLAGPGERLELSHRALSRDNFATGAVTAARWALRQPPGLYSMDDVLGI